MHGIDVGLSLNLINAAIAFCRVAVPRSARPQTSATRVLPGRAGAGMERAEEKLGIWQDRGGGGVYANTDLSLSL